MAFNLTIPVHPGELIKDEVLPQYGLTISKAADVLHVARPTFNNFLNGKGGISRELAYKLEAAFGVTAASLMMMQVAWDLWADQQRRGAVIDGIQRQVAVAA